MRVQAAASSTSAVLAPTTWITRLEARLEARPDTWHACNTVAGQVYV